MNKKRYLIVAITTILIAIAIILIIILTTGGSDGTPENISLTEEHIGEGFSFQYPEGWSLTENNNMVTISDASEDKATIIISKVSNSSSSLDSLTKENYMDTFGASAPGFEILSFEEKMINENKAIIVNMKYKDDAYTILMNQGLVQLGSDLILMQCQYFDDASTDYGQYLDAILNSLKTNE